MTSSQQFRLVAAGSILILAAYFPVAFIVGRSYVPGPVPAGAEKQIFALERLTPHGLAFASRIPAHRIRPEIRVYEDLKPLGPGNASMHEVDTLGGGRYMQENGVGIVLSASDSSNPRTNASRYWIVVPPAAPASAQPTNR